ncbi:hypothetical protein JTE90_012331 [Oedothorax gibbosus]|uniref:Uncharacterized protein n=1 Tax=Oedothorax gibbosus TaxID=931172 RepID=A0AAV6VKU6_9ARAC|nr:hypothetical protein JTE90_012331 [Oedothorax gibbosus]
MINARSTTNKETEEEERKKEGIAHKNSSVRSEPFASPCKNHLHDVRSGKTSTKLIEKNPVSEVSNPPPSLWRLCKEEDPQKKKSLQEDNKKKLGFKKTIKKKRFWELA